MFFLITEYLNYIKHSQTKLINLIIINNLYVAIMLTHAIENEIFKANRLNG